MIINAINKQTNKPGRNTNFGLSRQKEALIMIKAARAVAPEMKKQGRVDVETTIRVLGGLKQTKLWQDMEELKKDRASEAKPLLTDPKKPWGDLFDEPNNHNIWQSVSSSLELSITKLAGWISGLQQMRLTNYFGDARKMPNAVYLEPVGTPPPRTAIPSYKLETIAVGEKAPGNATKLRPIIDNLVNHLQAHTWEILWDKPSLFPRDPNKHLYF